MILAEIAHFWGSSRSRCSSEAYRAASRKRVPKSVSTRIFRTVFRRPPAWDKAALSCTSPIQHRNRLDCTPHDGEARDSSGPWLMIIFDDRVYAGDVVFYARKQLLLSARLSHRNSVRPSVRLSHGWISQKRCKIGLPNPHPRLPERL